jgi:hypothetical protein
MVYTKYHTVWVATDELSGAAFNHVETQWDDIKYDTDIHTHDDLYYTKTLSNAKFFTLSFYTGFDADKLDGDHFTDLVSSMLPIGAILGWDGTDDDVPVGWAICNGQVVGAYTTPDLRDRFVVCAGNIYDPGDVGGPATWNGTITPTGAVTIGDHILITAELPAHTHSFSETAHALSNWLTSGTGCPNALTSRSTAIANQTSGDGAHNHTTGSSITLDAIDTRPAYSSIYFIMKVE